MDDPTITVVIVAGAAVALVLIVTGISRAASRQAERRRKEEELERLSAKREMLLLKYRDPDLVDRLMRQTVWQGQTEEQIFDSLGPPLDIDQKVLKTKKKEIWKYNQTGVNRYGLKVTIENGVVIGWDQKD